MFSKILIANRGEIACRVIKTARRMGIATVAVYSDADVDARHVRLADEGVRLGPPPARESYLLGEKILAAAKATGAEAVHPGYGFLSENAAFAEACAAAGIVFVGPPAAAIRAMGSKSAAKQLMEKADVPLTPGYHGDDQDPALLAREAAAIGFPVLIKASAGGGGKGMRRVDAAADFEAALASCRREAKSAFGDDHVLVEQYVLRPRHIEIQVFADTLGHCIHLFERDCSVQRRHQKVLEEAPAPGMTAERRAAMGAAAVEAARAVGYVGAGTVEFIAHPDGRFYFMEMNTRLQVEHPVTEMITGVDLVEWQLRVAAGEPLPATQAQLAIGGHAIEARIYAEDSFGGFLPQAGRADLVRWAESGDRPASASESGGGRIERSSFTRVDHALESGQVVSTSFDPMLGKVISWGEDREAARDRLVHALDHSAVLGLTTNMGFVRALAASNDFRDATIDTAWLDHAEIPAPGVEIPLQLAAWVDAVLASPRFAADAGDPFAPDGWRSAGPQAPTLVALEHAGDLHELQVDVAASTIDGRPVRELTLADHVVALTLDSHDERAIVNAQSHVVEVSWRGQRFVFERPDAFADHGPAAGDGTLVAPMPGTVLDVLVTVGQQVAEGETLGAMEAMKMELALKAPFAGTVTEVSVVTGQQVALGASLIVVAGSDD